MLLPPASVALDEIAAFGRYAAGRGWVPATSGNFSVRVDARHAAVTRSGIDKGAIVAEGIAVVAVDEPVPAGLSAETPLHLARYRTDPSIGAVFHVHTVASTVLSKLDAERGAVRTDGLEMHKAIGLRTHQSIVEIPIFANDQDTTALAERVEAQLGVDAPIPAFLLAGHGIYAWGATAADARRHIEGIEFLLTCHLEERRLR
ncbi:MAG TPA: methylthioribulose 1-phosphate dehydratase [Candidatus Elarobacter sp.]|jgi:methylthioribulose-1-phosphate dehydratase